MSSSSNAPKRPQHKSKGSDSSTMTYSSTSTLVSSLDNWPFIEPPEAPKKPWAVKALKELGFKVKGSSMFKKGKEGSGGKRSPVCKGDIRVVGREDLDDFSEVLDISEEAVAATKEALLEKEEELDLLPDFPDPTEYRLPSLHDKRIQRMGHLRHQPRTSNGSRMRTGSSPDLRRACGRSGSTPNLLEAAAAKRESKDDPFYLEEYIKKFPTPPATLSAPRIMVSPPEEKPGAHSANPRMRCSSDASVSMPTKKAYTSVHKPKPVDAQLLRRPIDKEMMSRPRPHLAPKASLPSLQRF